MNMFVMDIQTARTNLMNPGKYVRIQAALIMGGNVQTTAISRSVD